MLRFLTAGESHGPAVTAILEGLPAGLRLSSSYIQKDLDKRKAGMGRGGRGLIETDQVEILSGIRKGKTIGSPITMQIMNRDYTNWEKEKVPQVSNPRPGHADLAGFLKYGFSDIRNVLERASARETVARVAVGAICRKLLSAFDINITSHSVAIGQERISRQDYSFEEVSGVFRSDPDTRCIDKVAAKKMKEAILKAIKEKNTLGGIVEVLAENMPVGLGSYVHFDRKLDGRLAQALMSIPSVKAVEIGSGIASSGKSGSDVHDELFLRKGKITRKTNNAGGLEGGVTNGEMIILRVFHKPLSTLGNPLKTVDLASKKESGALSERSDICVVPRAGVISEAMTAYVLSDAFLEKFGSDNLNDIKNSFTRYLKRIKKLL